MASYRPSEIILIGFPFTGSPTVKKRPALVLLDTGDADLLVARVTSQIARTPFDIEIVEWKRAGLALPSIVRLDKLATLEKAQVERKLGTLIRSDWNQIRAKIKEMWAAI
jgi:mRNA interferase MazF